MDKSEVKNILIGLPTQPGIYKYYHHKELIYVGKAKNLKKRVSSYFSKKHTSLKTSTLVKNITSIDFTITNTERDALLLENTLIKEFQPKYNINLKDDKTYPWIVIKNEPFPRIFFTRKKINDGSHYFGPYTSIQSAREVFQMIKDVFQFRTCKLNLSEKEIAKKKYKACLEFHLGNCKAPCVRKQSVIDYENDIYQIKNYLKGNLSSVIQYLKKTMLTFSEELNFEKAAIVKSKIDLFKNYSIKTGVVNFKVKNADVFTVKKVEDIAIVNYLMIENNDIINSHNQIVNLHADETEEEILETVIPFLQQMFTSTNKEIIVAKKITLSDEHYQISIPLAGDKKKLLEMSTKNSLYQLNELLRTRRKNALEKMDTNKVLEDLQSDLQLIEIPTHIECFDNSNLQGTNAVSAMVCFKNGIASKKDYRHFNVNTVKGIDDFGTMKEVVYRRYSRLIKEKEAIPQLVIIDGGKGQLNAANEAITQLGLQGKMTLIGLAKNIEEIFFIGDTESLKLGFNTSSLKLIRHIRDEVHRFGITHHRNKRSKSSLRSELEQIEGIGPKSINVLLKTFKSVNNIKQLSKEELSKVIGKKKSELLVNYFKNK